MHIITITHKARLIIYPIFQLGPRQCIGEGKHDGFGIHVMYRPPAPVMAIMDEDCVCVGEGSSIKEPWRNKHK